MATRQSPRPDFKAAIFILLSVQREAMHPSIYFRIGREAQDVNEAERETKRSGKWLRVCYLESEQLGAAGGKDETHPFAGLAKGKFGLKDRGEKKTTRDLRRQLQWQQ